MFRKKFWPSYFMAVLGTSVLLIAYQNCSTGFQSGISNVQKNATAQCTLPDSTQIEAAAFVEGFSSASSLYPLLCGQPVRRTCLSTGQFDGAMPLHSVCTQLCVHPENATPINAGYTFVYYTKGTGTSVADCDSARVSTTCNRDTGLFTPTVPLQRFSACLAQGQTCAYPNSAGVSVPTGNLTGATVTGYAIPSATHPTLCGARVTRTCQSNGQWGGTIPLHTLCLQRCSHPDAGSSQPIDANGQYQYYTRASGTATECAAARVTSICQQATGLFIPVVASTRSAICSVITAPIISSFIADPVTVPLGQSVTLRWDQTGATSLSLAPGGQNVTGQTQVTVSPTANTTYTLTATNSVGSVTRTVSVVIDTANSGEPYAIDVTKNPAAPAGSIVVKLTSFASGLNAPWGMAFLPDGRVLVSQKGGSLVLVSANGTTVSSAITGVPAVDSSGQGGLLDVVIDPQFTTNRRIYLTYAERDSSGNSGTAVARGELNATATALQNVIVILRQAKKSGTSNHYGSRLVFRGDGTLFVTLGDRFNFREEARSLTSYLGKVARINTDGTPSIGNPHASQSGVAAAIWTTGHRNIQAAALHPVTGELWVSEHGPQGGDEVNLALPGRNFGWPDVSYGCNYGDPVGTACRNGGGVHSPQFVEPLTYWYPTSMAPGGMAFYNGSLFPEWQNNLFVGALAGKALWRFVISNGRVTAHERLFTGLHEIRDVRMGPDGYLYVIARNSNQIYRVERQ